MGLRLAVVKARAPVVWPRMAVKGTARVQQRRKDETSEQVDEIEWPSLGRVLMLLRQAVKEQKVGPANVKS